MLCVCRLTRKLAQSWFLWQKAFWISALLQKLSSFMKFTRLV